mmetsp:Transcript_39384/g.130380  ORF Transcript_39384/g.130380 Transcript_39384/m.130380 type:complete len:359 (+) Transcript_39384:987-2063(+)
MVPFSVAPPPPAPPGRSESSSRDHGLKSRAEAGRPPSSASTSAHRRVRTSARLLAAHRTACAVHQPSGPPSGGRWEDRHPIRRPPVGSSSSTTCDASHAVCEATAPRCGRIASGGNVSMSEARRSGEKTKALPTSLPRPRVVKMGCPDGHRPLPPSSPNTAASAARISFSLRGGSANPPKRPSRSRDSVGSAAAAARRARSGCSTSSASSRLSGTASSSCASTMQTRCCRAGSWTRSSSASRPSTRARAWSATTSSTRPTPSRSPCWAARAASSPSLTRSAASREARTRRSWKRCTPASKSRGRASTRAPASAPARRARPWRLRSGRRPSSACGTTRRRCSTPRAAGSKRTAPPSGTR